MATRIRPKLADVDVRLKKNFKLNEQANVVCRLERLNILDHANCGLPIVTMIGARGTANPAPATSPGP